MEKSFKTTEHLEQDNQLKEGVLYYLDSSCTSTGVYMKKNKNTVCFYSDNHHDIYCVNKEGLVNFPICGNEFERVNKN